VIEINPRGAPVVPSIPAAAISEHTAQIDFQSGCALLVHLNQHSGLSRPERFYRRHLRFDV
jgi:hypothetical protein